MVIQLAIFLIESEWEHDGIVSQHITGNFGLDSIIKAYVS